MVQIQQNLVIPRAALLKPKVKSLFPRTEVPQLKT